MLYIVFKKAPNTNKTPPANRTTVIEVLKPKRLTAAGVVNGKTMTNAPAKATNHGMNANLPSAAAKTIAMLIVNINNANSSPNRSRRLM